MKQNASTVITYYLSNVKTHATKYRKGAPKVAPMFDFGWEKKISRTITLRSRKLAGVNKNLKKKTKKGSEMHCVI